MSLFKKKKEFVPPSNALNQVAVPDEGPRKEQFGESFSVGILDDFVNWGNSYSIWPFPFATACCGIEYMATVAADYDIARFGAERPSFSPRQADLVFILGTITYKMAPVLRNIYNQLAAPRYVVSVGACASSGGMFHTYSVLQGVDRILPVDVYVPGCPPRPEAILQSLINLQEKVKGQTIEERRAYVKARITEIENRQRPRMVK